jgi:hypothetical protein
MRLIATALAVLALPALACDSGLDFEAGPEQVTMHLTAIPADVACIRLSAAGSTRTAVRLMPTEGEPNLTRNLSGLPLGAVEFLSEAFHQGCDKVTKATIPSWVSEPVTANLAVGRLVSISLLLQRNGRAKVQLGFGDEGLPAADGGADPQ